MGYLFHILFALAIQAAAEANLATPWRLPWLLPLLLPLPHLLAIRARHLALTGRFRLADLHARLLQHSPVLLHGVAVLALGWLSTLRAWTGADLDLLAWPRLASCLSLAPFVVLELVAIDAYARAMQAGRHERARMRSFQLRMFASGLAPLAAYLVVAALVGWNVVLRRNVEHVALLNALFVGSLLLGLATFLPWLLARTWDTVPIGRGPVRELLEAVAERARFRARELYVWRTGNLMANAAIVGMFPGSRVVLFSDSLLSMLGPRELAAVFAHEIGHAMRHHVAIFMAWVLVFLLGGDLLLSGLLADFEGDATWIVAGAGAGVFVLWFLAFGWLSRRFELEADLYSIDLLGDPLGIISALERVGGRLRDVAGWRHFSTDARIAFLSRATADPGFVRRFRARLRCFGLAGLLLAGAVVVGQGVALARSWRADRVVVALSLGRYEAASRGLRRVSERDEWLAELVAQGESLSLELGRAARVEDLESALERAIDARDWSRGAALAGLLELRERPGSSGLTAVLGALGEERSELAVASLAQARGLDTRWRRLLEPHVEVQ